MGQGLAPSPHVGTLSGSPVQWQLLPGAWATPYPFSQALFAASMSMRPGGLVGLASHIGMTPLAVPSPLGVGGMSDEAAGWECAHGRKHGPEILFLI